MGKYRGAVVTAAGQNLIAEAIASSGVITWTTAEASSYAYPASTNFEAMTSLQSVEQSVAVSSVGVYSDNVLQVACRFDNTGVETAYLIQTIGLYAQLGSGTPVLVAVVAADTPDQMPVENLEAPSAFIYNVQMTVQNADQITFSVNPAGTATAADLHALQERVTTIEAEMPDKADLVTLATVEATATASRAYAVGEYLIREGVLYEVTTAIPLAGTITPGTNVATTTVGGELKGLDEEKADYADLAPVEETATASRAYKVDEYLVYNGTLYRVTTAIASGGTITPGTNTAAVTAGSELKALADTKSNLSNIAVIEATNTASRAYAVGAYIAYNGTLYKVSSAIASGATLVPGTNITEVKVGGQLRAINDTLAKIGNISQKLVTPAVSVPAGATGKLLGSLELAAGTYLVEFCAIFAEGTAPTGYRLSSINTSNALNTGDLYRCQTSPAPMNSNSSKTIAIRQNATNTWYLWAAHTSGSALNVQGYIKAMRISDY